jgi:predicted phage baseplate assembly protein
MPLQIPNLDDRRFQDLVDEAKRRIPLYCPEWTDHNVSDPGIMLVELFAWMVESMIYRLNRVPDKNYITFMDLIGVQLQPPRAARTELTFWLSAPATQSVTILLGTEVMTIQTSSEEAVTFSTDAALALRPPRPVAYLTSPAAPAEDQRKFEDQKWRLDSDAESIQVFSETPEPGDAFYLGDSRDLSGHILALDIDASSKAGIGVNPDDPPLIWEAWCDAGWVAAEVERDETGGLNQQGQVLLHLPQRMARRTIEIPNVGAQAAFWVRCRHVQPQPGQPTYQQSPQIRTIVATTLGGTVGATHAITTSTEIVGRSDGTPSQRFRLEFTPVLPRLEGETVEVEVDGVWEAWIERTHFGESAPKHPHFVLDSVTGEISFGPAIRETDGMVRQYGAIPPRGSQIRFSRYRSGGGAIGNVPKGKLALLKSAVPFVDHVENRRPAGGGRDAESLEHAKQRAPQMFRTRDRAVTAEDYEYLARAGGEGIARAHCLQPRAPKTTGSPPAGVVRVLIVPSLERPARRLLPDELRAPDEVVRRVQDYLDERRLLTSVVVVGPPSYTVVAIEAAIKARSRAESDVERIRQESLSRLERYINPLTGGPDGDGWPFGRTMHISEIYSLLQGVPGVEFIDQITLRVNDKVSKDSRVVIPEDGLITSGEHQIKFV